ncbi:sensor histidine kinase [Herbidospora daliensis]|uniref:sensor histidine kinase n=1 Tax=Herbidospora daliensis TaxID=295585 RepID=UPI000780B0AC|nr:sensor histidine kinase [Herbidospora daliensis]
MNRALAVLTFGALLTLLIGVVASGESLPALLLGTVFTALATAGFSWVRARGRPAWSFGYIAVQLPIAFVVFSLNAGVGATLLLLVLVSQCVLLRLPVAATAVVVGVVPFVHLGMSWGEGLREGLGILVAAVFAAIVTELLQREQRARAELAVAHERLRDYAAQAERLATVQERNRVARDIHDGLGHSLTVVQMQVKAARAVLPIDVAKADEVLAKAQDQAEAALAEVRRSVRTLREPREVPPLPDALEVLAELTSASGVATSVAISGERRPLSDETREALFRAAQEGLTNVRKHAGATQAELVLDYVDAAVRLAVRDDGGGSASAATSGFGLVGLRERAEQLGGRLSVESAPGAGYTLSMEVPG